MTEGFGTVTIIGAGLLGASLGLALKSRKLVDAIRGVGHRQSSLESARAAGAIDQAFLDARQAVEGADVVVVCTPAALVIEKLDEIRPRCSAHTVVTDVASTKTLICAHAAGTWPKPRRFIGSHPMAGSEKFGPEHADAALYAGRFTIVASEPELAPDAQETVRRLWESVGATVVELAPEEHDRVAAQTSHLPHIVAACLSELAGDAGNVRPLVGNGFRDVTRIAAGRPEVWRDICLTNRDAILQALDKLGRELDGVRRIVAESSGEALEAFFRSAQQARSRVVGE